MIGYFSWKYIKFQLKKVWRSYAWWYLRVVQNLKRNLFFVSKITRIWWFLIQALKSLKNLHLIGPFCAKYKIFDLKKYIGVYFMTLKSHAKFEEKLIWKKWLEKVVWKMIWRIWQIFIRTLENVKIAIFMGSFCPK